MNHVAVDLGSKQSQFCIRGEAGQVLREGRLANRHLRTLFRVQERSRVVLETSAEAFAVATLAREAGHEVRVVPATLAPSLGVGQRGVKTDKRDAQNLSMASCRIEELPQVHIPSTFARELRAQLTSRARLVHVRTQLINSVRGWGRTELLEIQKATRENFPEKARRAALERPEGLPQHVERLLRVLEAANAAIKEANEELEELTQRDEVCRRLRTGPGVGPVTSASYRAALDDVTRFKSAHAVESYLGLTPGERSSGERTRRTGITGAGAARVRAALVQAAWCAWRTRPGDPMVTWARTLAMRKPKQVAIVALARKLAGVLYALWRDETDYNPAHAAQAPVTLTTH